jgi:hypothetical protein
MYMDVAVQHLTDGYYLDKLLHVSPLTVNH